LGTCTESALDACLPGGESFTGTVTFSCGGAATIAVTNTKTISADTTIDGGSLITISGGNSVTAFNVEGLKTAVTFTVQNLTIANGNSAGEGGGGISSSGGSWSWVNTGLNGNALYVYALRSGALRWESPLHTMKTPARFVNENTVVVGSDDQAG